MKNNIIFLSALIFGAATYASDGNLDATFGVAGVIDAPAGTFVNGLAVQVDGKIVAFGSDPTNSFFQLVRYNTDGSLDGTFGNAGIVIGPNAPNRAALLIQPDGKIVVAGNDFADNILLARYNTDGTPDDSFGVNGVVTSIPGTPYGIAFETGGTIVVSGQESNTFLVVRYNPNGSLNLVFSGSVTGAGSDLALQNDGKIVVVGQSVTDQVEVARYLPNGTLDATFGTGGIAMGPVGTNVSVAVQSNGQIVVGSSGGTFPSNFFQITQFNANGSINTGYGTAGTASGPFGIASSIRLQSDSKAVLVGQATSLNYQVARYTTTGILDTSFGDGTGFVTVPSGTVGAAALQANGFILAAGSDEEVVNYQVARYIAHPPLVPTQIITPADGSGILPGTVNFTGTAQNPANVYLVLDGTIIGGVATAPGAADSWSFSITLTPGTYTAQAVALYEDGSVNIASPEITFTVAETLLNATKTDSTNGENVRNCSTLTYTITVTNTGPVEAHKVLVTDTLPTGVTFVTASTSNGKSVSQSGGVVTAMLGGIDVGDTVTVTITVQVKASVIGSLVNTAVVSGLNTQSINLTDTVVVAQTCAVNCIVTCS
jgi:uncharacterized repeat protein (TIGR01451 family)/uncharacterized delta-60 repeat protein